MASEKLSKTEKCKIALKTCLIESWVATILVFSGRWLPDFRFPSLLELLVFICFFVAFAVVSYWGRYYPQLVADEELEIWLGDQYRSTLSDKLEKESFGRLLRKGWFRKHVKDEERARGIRHS